MANCAETSGSPVERAEMSGADASGRDRVKLLLWPACEQAGHTAAKAPSMTAVMLESTLTCPECGHVKIETMPTDACQWFYECEHCRVVLRPKPGDCCVFCSYGSVPCPPIQTGTQGNGCGACQRD